jgi:probable phosphoglycerate mutase
VTRRCIGQLDRPLTDTGRAQAEAARAICATLDISVVVHSPLARAADTAAVIAAGRLPLAPRPDLMEAHLGAMQGAREDDPANPFIRHWIAGHAIAGAETYAGLKLRVATAMREVLSALPSEAAPPLIVSHAGVYHALRDVIGVPAQRVRHCQPYDHRPVGGAWDVLEVML